MAEYVHASEAFRLYRPLGPVFEGAQLPLN